MTRSLLKQEAKKQLSKNLGTLILTGLLLGIIKNLPDSFRSFGMTAAISNLKPPTDLNALADWFMRITLHPTYQTFSSISIWIGLAVLLFAPVLTLGVHYVYLKATTEEKPHFSEMFSKMSQFGTAFLTSLLSAIFIILWTLLLIIPGIIAAYSYSMRYYVLADHPDYSAMDAIRESKGIMKGHKFELFVLQISFIWWILLCVVTLGLASLYVIPYMEMAKANFYNKIKEAA
ncbi:MAG: DUF975 family protein [Clostridia bacterium]|nr:DUF975 family protein [Clostridia bacterium]